MRLSSSRTPEMKRGAKALLSKKERVAELEASRRWIPVTERLPETDDACLVLQVDGNGMHDGPLVAYPEAGSWWSRFGDVVEGVTLWMPIPEAML